MLPPGYELRRLAVDHAPALAAAYLFIAGAWQDHLLFQRVLDDRPAGAAAP